MSELMKRCASALPYLMSTAWSRLETIFFRGISSSARLLLPLGAVLRAALVAAVDAARVECAAHDVIAHARQVLHTAAAHEHDRVLLEVVALAGDVARDLGLVREADTRDLAEGGVRLLRRRRVDARADATLLRT